MVLLNPNLLPVYELRFYVNRFSHEVIIRNHNKGLCYGMRTKLTLEKPETYPKQKLIVKKIK